MEIQEIWKDIPGWEGRYMVSNLGKVKSLPHYNSSQRGYLTPEKILKPASEKDGYLFVGLYMNGKRKHRKIHRIVAAVFHGLDMNNAKQLACHKDDNPKNNREDNIFIGTSKDNTEDMMRKSRFRKSPKLLQFTRNGKIIKSWECLAIAVKELGISRSHISDCCSGRTDRKTAGGFIWQYEKKVDDSQ